MRILLVNPPSGAIVYAKSKVNIAITYAPYLTTAVLAASARAAGAKVSVLDLIISNSPHEDLVTELKRFKPDIVGVTFTTQLFYEAQAIATIAKKINPKVITLCGGIHTSCMPEETLAAGDFDIACIGEGDQTIAELAGGTDPAQVDGLLIKHDGKFIHTPPRQMIANLDDLPFPAFDLYPIHRYKSPRLTSKRDPVGYMESCRGCPYRCIFCSCVPGFRNKVRKKSPERVVEEFFYLRSMGFNDIHIKEDNFTVDPNRAKQICELLIKRGWDRPWCAPTGMRPKDVDVEFVNLAKRSGCHNLSFGIESGDERVLAGINKKQDLGQIAWAVDLCTRAGIVTKGFFMVGMPDDNIETMERSIKYACSLNLNYIKASVMIPLPGSALFEEYDKKGLILCRDWSKYNFHTAPEIYRHPTLEWSTIRHYYAKFYRSFYLRPGYIAKKTMRDVATGEIVRDVQYFFKADWGE
jgi:anaerobic magnesium-protoporphyrin IX monomethyl ester cyclase